MAEGAKSNGAAGTVEDLRAEVLTTDFQREIWELFKKYQVQEDVLSPTDFYKAVALALMQVCAVLAVDVKITDAQFLGMAKVLWDNVYEKAPRFS